MKGKKMKMNTPTEIAVAAAGEWTADVGQECLEAAGWGGHTVTGDGHAGMEYPTCAPGPFVHGYVVWPLDGGDELVVPLGPHAMRGLSVSPAETVTTEGRVAAGLRL